MQIVGTVLKIPSACAGVAGILGKL